jgi:hypothetical protein
MNVEEFFEFCRTHPEERYEYIHGYAYRLMAGGDSNHSLVKMNVYREFGIGLNLPIEVLYENVIFPVSTPNGPPEQSERV